MSQGYPDEGIQKAVEQTQIDAADLRDKQERARKIAEQNRRTEQTKIDKTEYRRNGDAT